MTKNEALKIYTKTNEKLNYYNLLIQTASFDKETIAPIKGNEQRNDAMSFMYGEIYDIETSKDYIEAVKTLHDLDLGSDSNRELSLRYKSLQNSIKFSKEETVEFNKLCFEAGDSWLLAKSKGDYKIFESYLKKLVEISIKRAKVKNPKATPYNVQLDDFQDGMDIKQYDKFFDGIKKELLPLIKNIDNKKALIDDSFAKNKFDVDKQRKLSELLLKYLNFNSDWGYLGESEHPFTTNLSKNDCRTTTHYYEDNFISSIYSIIHEVGHAYYDHQIDSKYQGTMIQYGITMGMHESQSRFNENYIGKRKAFWSTLYPKIQKLFPESLKDVSIDDFIKACNKVECSKIRTQADELTYPIHILIRYEIEKDLFSGKLKTKDLNKVWNKKYKEYLGLDIKNDSEGILQDIHWSMGSFGYFPTYALGSAIGAQLLNKMESELDVDKLLETNKYSQIQKWLKDNVQKYGALYDVNTLLKKVTGENFNSKYYINYLKKKYKSLYKIR